MHERVDTIADGIAVRLPVPEALEDMAGLVDDALLVDDEAILRATRLLHEHVGVVSEPSGAVGAAAVSAHAEKFRGAHVGTIICGGNVTTEQMKRWF